MSKDAQLGMVFACVKYFFLSPDICSWIVWPTTQKMFKKEIRSVLKTNIIMQAISPKKKINRIILYIL